MSAISSVSVMTNSIHRKKSSENSDDSVKITLGNSEAARGIVKDLLSPSIDTTNRLLTSFRSSDLNSSCYPESNTLIHAQSQLRAEIERISVRLNQLQKTLSPVSEQLLSSMKAEINQCFIDNLHKESALHHESSYLGRVYQVVIAEECEVQDKQTEKYQMQMRQRDRLDSVNNSLLSCKEEGGAHLAKEHGEMKFLNHKLAIINFSQKINDLYIASSWQPDANTLNKIHLLTSSKEGVIRKELSRNELSNLATAISSKYEAKRGYLTDNLAKNLLKYNPVVTPFYILNISDIRGSTNKRLEAQKNEIDNCNKKIEELFGTQTIRRKDISQLFIDTLKKPMHGENLLEKQLKIYHEIPTVSSIRGTDPDTGLYHERQFSGSGTCLLHANNHYLASRHAEQNKPFLALTPKRMELLINGMVNQKRSDMNYSAAICLGSHRKQSNFVKVFNVQDKGLKAIELKYSEYKKNVVSNYNYKPNDPYSDKYALKDNSVLTTNIGTGEFEYSGIMSFLNSSFGLNNLTHEKFRAMEWNENKNKLSDFMDKSNQIRFNVHTVFSGHAMCFTKQNEKWYLQDSHFESPVPCTPLELIDHLNYNDNSNSELNNIGINGKTTTFRSHHSLLSTAKIEFGYYS